MIFIPGQVPSLKNSKVKGIYHPVTVTKYLRSLGIQGYSASEKTVKEYKDPNRPNLFRKYVGNYFEGAEYPIVLGFHFVRGRRGSWDIGNAQHILLDLLTAHDLIQDDNADCLIPQSFKIDGRWYSYSKERPGVYLKILGDE